MTELNKIVSFLDKELRIADFKDSSHNGLQVAGMGEIRKVCCGVDASLEFFREAEKRGADMVVCHHGISWGDSLKRITELNYGRVSFLIKKDIALYACHLPLDAHPKLGNNISIARGLGLTVIKPFGLYNGVKIGFQGCFSKPIRYDALKRKLHALTGGELRSMDFGKKTIRTVAVVSGCAPEEIEEAGRDGIDVYVSGEPGLQAYSPAQEYMINAVFAGHYATEVFGVRNLAAVLSKKFKLEAEFIDLKVPF